MPKCEKSSEKKEHKNIASKKKRSKHSKKYAATLAKWKKSGSAEQMNGELHRQLNDLIAESVLKPHKEISKRIRQIKHEM
jgi:hypothetical protein